MAEGAETKPQASWDRDYTVYVSIELPMKVIDAARISYQGDVPIFQLGEKVAALLHLSAVPIDVFEFEKGKALITRIRCPQHGDVTITSTVYDYVRGFGRLQLHGARSIEELTEALQIFEIWYKWAGSLPGE